MNSGNNGISCSSVSSLLVELWISGIDMVNWRCLCNVAVWIRDLCNVLRLEKSFHNWDWYSLIWFAWLRVLFPRVVHVSLSIVLWPCFIIHYELVTMHAPWLSHCKSSWSCMNWKLGSKHLDVIHGVVPHVATICSTTKWSDRPNLRDKRCVKKFSNLLCLTEWGFYGHLEEDGLFYLNMDV